MTDPTSERRIALLTIGQSPRPDLCEAILRALPATVRVWESGVLDGMDAATMAEDFAVGPNESPLISRMADGSTVSLGEAAVERGLQRAIDRLEAAGVDVVVVLCTGQFKSLHTRAAWLVEPDRVVVAAVASLVADRCLGLLAPLPAQESMLLAKWRPHVATLRAGAASPYGPMQDVVDRVGDLVAQGAQAVVLDCMGYTDAHRQALLAAGVTVPVFVSGAVLASVLRLL